MYVRQDSSDDDESDDDESDAVRHTHTPSPWLAV
jgi:hypothetical protein